MFFSSAENMIYINIFVDCVSFDFFMACVKCLKF